MENLNTAFDVAEKYLDIPRMLDPDGKFSQFHHFIISVDLFSEHIFKFELLLSFMLGSMIRFDQYTKTRRKSHHDLRVMLLSCLPRRSAGSQKLFRFCNLPT